MIRIGMLNYSFCSNKICTENIIPAESGTIATLQYFSEFIVCGF